MTIFLPFQNGGDFTAEAAAQRNGIGAAKQALIGCFTLERLG